MMLKRACYLNNLSMSAVAALTALLMLRLRAQFDLSFSQLGTLVAIMFVTQLVMDLVFTFFPRYFNIPKTVRLMPWLTVIGLALYALLPMLFPGAAYAGLMAGTVLFSAASGLNEVLTTPLVATIPAENPERELSKLHSVYAWGVVGVAVVTTLWLTVFDWPYLVLLYTLLPLGAAMLFARADVPDLPAQSPTSGERISGVMWLCVALIFLGGAAEGVMTQWISTYLEGAMNIPKLWGDLLGVALFAAMLGLGRTLYGRYGRTIGPVILWGSAGAALCYLAAALSPVPGLGLAACAITGLCVSMMWPGSLILCTEKIPGGGVMCFALMAAGGDLGAALGPQLMAWLTDAMLALGQPQESALRTAMLAATVFPIGTGLLCRKVMTCGQTRPKG